MVGKTLESDLSVPYTKYELDSLAMGNEGGPNDVTDQQPSILVRDPRILGGKLTIRGTRIPVAIICASYAMSGGDIAQLVEDFPTLPGLRAIDASLNYQETFPRQIEEELRDYQE